MTVSALPVPTAPRPSSSLSRVARALAMVAIVGVCALLAWQGGPVGLAGLALAAVAGWRLMPAFAAAGGELPEAPVDGRLGAEVMVSEVVPVWSRQMQLTGDVAQEGVGGILESFSSISGALQSLVDQLQAQTIAAEPGQVDATVRGQAAALEPLLAASQRAFEQRDAAFVEVGRIAETLHPLKLQVKLVRELARHSRLVAFNASIESTGRASAGTKDDGRAAVAAEMRVLSDRIGQAADCIAGIVSGLEGPLAQMQRLGEIHDTSDEELRLEIDLAARQALQALLGALGPALAGSDEVARTIDTLRAQLDDSFVHFQFGDRLSQQLSIVGNDMSNFAAWVASHPQATQADAATWLQALEASYTMEEQRSGHHGNVHVHNSTGVEFF